MKNPFAPAATGERLANRLEKFDRRRIRREFYLALLDYHRLSKASGSLFGPVYLLETKEGWPTHDESSPALREARRTRIQANALVNHKMLDIVDRFGPHSEPILSRLSRLAFSALYLPLAATVAWAGLDLVFPRVSAAINGGIAVHVIGLSLLASAAVSGAFLFINRYINEGIIHQINLRFASYQLFYGRFADGRETHE